MEVEVEEERDELEADEARQAEVEAVRAVVLSAYRDVVPELVQGETVQELLDSVEAARAAYARLAAAFEPGQTAPPPVPAGGGAAIVDLSEIPASEKVRRGIAASR